MGVKQNTGCSIVRPMSRNVRKRTFCHVRQSKTRTRLSLRFPHEETLLSSLCKTRPVNFLIRLRKWAGWSEYSLGAHVRIGTVSDVAALMYSWTAVARTPMARLPWLIWTRFLSPYDNFSDSSRKLILRVIYFWNCLLCVPIRIASSRQF